MSLPKGEVLEPNNPGANSIGVRRPLGVICSFTPWKLIGSNAVSQKSSSIDDFPGSRIHAHQVFCRTLQARSIRSMLPSLAWTATVVCGLLDMPFFSNV
jgi:hypothetical protein